MLSARLATLGVLAAVLASTGAAQARLDANSPQTLAPPSDLHAFLLRADEAEVRTFPRTPSFAWNPVPSAWRYEFQLSTSLAFGEGTIVWESADSTKPLRVPVVAVDVALPWITGNPYSLYARVRAVKLVPLGRKAQEGAGATGASGPTGAAGPTGAVGPTGAAAAAAAASKVVGEEVFGAWSTPFGFNMRWTNVPKTMTPNYTPGISSPRPGLLYWNPVEGATAYDVMILGARRRFVTTTNVADSRDVFTFGSRVVTPGASISWRVRAIRRLYGEIPNGMPATTYGPWSEVFRETVDQPSSPTLSLVEAVSGGAASTMTSPQVHNFTPAFRFTPDASWLARGFLYRVYVASDADCVNIVYTGAAVPGPTYAPRATGPLKLPQKYLEILGMVNAGGGIVDHGTESDTFMYDGTKFATTEAGSGGPWGARVDLWDTAWPNGGYYWTVVPVYWVQKSDDVTNVEWRDLELPQDACQSGRVMRFGKTSSAVVASSTAPYASGLSPKGKLASAGGQKPSFYGTPLVSWEPALGADSYEVQWSKTGYPWKTDGKAETGSTALMLPVEPGTWYYRVRGLNNSLPKKPQMTWSLPVQINVSKPEFKVVGGAQGLVLEASGLVRYGSPVGFSLAVPPAWQVLVNSPTAFQAQAAKGDVSSATVLFNDRKPPASTDAWRTALMAEASATSGYVKGTLQASLARLPAGTAVKLAFKKRSGKVTLSIVRWVVFPGDRAYSLTYSTTPARLGKLAKVFESSAKSFRLT